MEVKLSLNGYEHRFGNTLEAHVFFLCKDAPENF